MTNRANQLTERATSSNPGAPLVPARQLRAFVDAFERLGYDVGRLLSDADLPRTALDDPDALIPCAASGAFFDRALRERPLKNVGLKLAAQTPVGALGLLDYLVLTSDTVGNGLEQLATYLRALTGAPFLLELHEDEDPIRVVYLVDAGVATFGIEYSLCLTALHVREETDNRVGLEYVSLTYQPDDVTEIEQVIGCPARTGMSWAGLALSRESWQTPLRRRDPLLQSLLERHASSIPSQPLAMDGLAVEVRRVLAARLANGDTEIENIARDLGMSTRTLQRRLSGAGWSYQGLLDDTRRDAAERCMTGSNLSIGEIGYLLGYSEPAAFHRAFKRWTGETPQAFRQRHHARLPEERAPSSLRTANPRKQTE